MIYPETRDRFMWRNKVVHGFDTGALYVGRPSPASLGALIQRSYKMSKFTFLVMAMTVMLGGYLISGVVLAEDKPLINGDFETEDMTGWTTFTTTNGTLGPGYPRVVLFDTNGDGTATYSAQFSVGQEKNENLTKRGAGIYQNVHLAEGEYQITTDIAVGFGTPEVGSATQGGLFELLVDGVVVASHNFGYVDAGTARTSLLASVPIYTTGAYEIRIRITRPGNPPPELNQYIDNVLLSGGEVPTDPATSDSKPGKSNSSGQSTDADKNCNYQAGKPGGNKGGNPDKCNALKK